MDISLTLSNREISPAVVNMYQFENDTTTLNFALDSYMYGEVDLRNYTAYVITSINGLIDYTELTKTYNADKDTLTLSWDVQEYSLRQEGAVLYQIVFKESTAAGLPEEGENTAVFYSYKGVLINRGSIDGDNHMTANYPTLLKQWLDRMNAMADLYDAGVVYMNYGETIPVEDRLAGRLYFQYTDSLNTKGQFEDDEGHILTDPNVVHLIGAETISGTKTFTSEIQRRDALSAGATVAIKTIDDGGHGELTLEGYYTNEQLYERIRSFNETSGKDFYIDIINTDDGWGTVVIGGTATSNNLTGASNGTGDTSLALKGWVNNPEKSTNVVHRTGTEEIAGAKTFNNTLTAKGGFEISYSTPYIDFHFDNTTDDYTSRIIESKRGVLSLSNSTPSDATGKEIATADFVKANGGLKNDATGKNSLSVLGYATTASYAINVGWLSYAGADYGVALGYYASVGGDNAVAIGNSSNGTGANSVAIGYQATTLKDNTIQLGTGGNATANTMQVWDYTLLDKSTGQIPNARLSILDSETGLISKDLLPSLGASLPVLMQFMSKHILNDISFLRADTFSWQSGDVYVAAYEHLASEYNPTGVTYYCFGPDSVYGKYLFTTTATPSVGSTVYVSDSSSLDLSTAKTGTIDEVSGDTITERDYVATRNSQYDKTVLELQADTIGDITIAYYQAADNHKICLPDQESNIIALYESTGAADYYILDTDNTRFKLPRNHKRKLIHAVKNGDGTWYNLYSDGWVEQGGVAQGSSGTITLPVEMADTNYSIQATVKNSTNDQSVHEFQARTPTTTTIPYKCSYVAATTSGAATESFYWQVSGYAAESAYAGAAMELEYYYVGNFEKEAVEQTAGINAELFNTKVDKDDVAAIAVSSTMLDYTAEVNGIALPYTATQRGMVRVTFMLTSDYAYVKVNGITALYAGGSNNNRDTALIPVDIGDVVTIDGTVSSSSGSFIPFKGV